MAPLVFIITAVLFWVFFALRLLLAQKKFPRLDQATTIGEKLAYILFTFGLAIYIYYFHEQHDSWMIQTLTAKKPISWLLFVWCVYSAQILVEVFYGSFITKNFANFWVAASLTLLPNASPQSIHAIFTSDAVWLNFHRLSFLLGYSFCILAMPLAFAYLWQHARIARLPDVEQIQEQQKLWMLDRMQYRMILWALPLLTLGIVVEAFLLMERGSFPSPVEIWTEQKESFLALATWFFCGFYLHTRLFFAWRDVRSSALYLAAFTLIFIGHVSEHFLHFQ